MNYEDQMFGHPWGSYESMRNTQSQFGRAYEQAFTNQRSFDYGSFSQAYAQQANAFARQAETGLSRQVLSLLRRLRQEGGYTPILPSDKQALAYCLQRGHVLLVRSVTNRGKVSDLFSVTRSGHAFIS